jgi:hypothetical protein
MLKYDSVLARLWEYFVVSLFFETPNTQKSFTSTRSFILLIHFIYSIDYFISLLTLLYQIHIQINVNKIKFIMKNNKPSL